MDVMEVDSDDEFDVRVVRLSKASLLRELFLVFPSARRVDERIKEAKVWCAVCTFQRTRHDLITRGDEAERDKEKKGERFVAFARALREITVSNERDNERESCDEKKRKPQNLTGEKEREKRIDERARDELVGDEHRKHLQHATTIEAENSAFFSQCFWSDAADPATGCPLFGERSSATHDELEWVQRLLKFRTIIAGPCCVLEHPKFLTRCYPATAFICATDEAFVAKCVEEAKKKAIGGC